MSLKTGERRTLVPGATVGRFVPPGYLIYQQGNILMAAPFDPVRLKVTGAAVPIVERVLTHQYNFSSSGSLVYVPGNPGSAEWEANLVMVDRKGTAETLPAPVRPYAGAPISPDGNRLAVQIGDRDTAEVWVYDLLRQTLTRLTYEGAGNPIWMPDGKRISYLSRRGGARRLFWKNFDGSGTEEEILKGEFEHTSWSPDGQYLAVQELSHSSRSWDIWVYTMEDKKRQPFLQTPFNEAGAKFSPDGHRLTYDSEESGQSEVYVRAFPGPEGKWQISTEGGCCAVWAQSGREMFYIQDNKMMVVDITTSPDFTVGKPRMLFEREDLNYSGVTPDSQRFIMIQQQKKKEAAPMQLNLVLNWFVELKPRVPSGKK